jgi:hypothetical protein
MALGSVYNYLRSGSADYLLPLLLVAAYHMSYKPDLASANMRVTDDVMDFALFATGAVVRLFLYAFKTLWHHC